MVPRAIPYDIRQSNANMYIIATWRFKVFLSLSLLLRTEPLSPCSLRLSSLAPSLFDLPIPQASLGNIA
jgi:hypothetical protein